MPLALKRVRMESNRWYTGKTSPEDRYLEVMYLPDHIQTIIEIDPVLEFDTERFVRMIENMNPSRVDIGAAKNRDYPEPSKRKLQRLIQLLRKRGIEVRQKSNLKRLLS